ncbi:MAG: preprotein translocase subunit SecG [Thermodesulfobacteriota bacterium]
MSILITLIHVIVCILLIVIILLQAGKGAGMGAAFGGGGSQTLFGSTGGTSFLAKLTAGAAIIFMLTCLTLAYTSATRKSESILTDEPAPVSQPAEKAPAAPQPPAASE